tara:strand:+ start:122 stop:742 length:621 start_codon:yes stop_codon:yes gene_type:complete
MRISLLRHGHTVADDIYRGHTDVALTAAGLLQMQQAYSALPVAVDYLVSSTLQRCAKFAQSIAPHEQLDERLKEISFGDWDGQSRLQIWQTQPEAVSEFWSNPMHSCAPNGETVSQLQPRVMLALHEHVKQAISQKCEHMLLVTHGGVIRAMLGAILHMGPKGLFNINLPYGGVAPLHVACFEDEHGQADYHISLDFAAVLAVSDV